MVLRKSKNKVEYLFLIVREIQEESTKRILSQIMYCKKKKKPFKVTTIKTKIEFVVARITLAPCWLHRCAQRYNVSGIMILKRK